MELKELITKIEQWGIDRELDKKATVEAQSIKTAEEMAELIIGISKDNIDVIKDSIGDVFVTLVIGNMIDEKLDINKMLYDTQVDMHAEKKSVLIRNLGIKIMQIIDKGYREGVVLWLIKKLKDVCRAYNLKFTDCIEIAYNEIKDRKGKTIDGQFIKESDL